MLAHFHQISLIGPLANALVLPFLPAVMTLGGAGALVGSPLGMAGWPLMQSAGVIVNWYRLVIEGLSSLPLAAITMPYFPSRWLAAAVIVNGSALVGVRLRQFFWRKKVWLLLVLATLGALAFLLVRPDGRVHVYALDVGTGSAVLVRTANGHQVLIDAGPDADKLTDRCFAAASGRRPCGRERDGEVRHAIVEAMQQLPDGRLDDGFLVVVAGEGLDRLDRVPGRRHHQFGFVASGSGEYSGLDKACD